MLASEFLTGLFIISVLVSLTVEALKKMLGEKKLIPTNILTGIVSVVVSVVVGIFYCVLNDVPFTTDVFVYLVALVFFSWLCAMLGYDKIIQSFKQIKKMR